MNAQFRWRASMKGDSKLACPACAGHRVTVVDSRPTKSGIRRRRYCQGCGHKFTTYESPTGDGRATELAGRIAALSNADHTLILTMVDRLEHTASYQAARDVVNDDDEWPARQ